VDCSQAELADNDFVVFVVIFILTDVTDHVIIHFIFRNFYQGIWVIRVNDYNLLLFLGFRGSWNLLRLSTNQSFLHLYLTKRPSLVFSPTIVPFSLLDRCFLSFCYDWYFLLSHVWLLETFVAYLCLLRRHVWLLETFVAHLCLLRRHVCILETFEALFRLSSFFWIHHRTLDVLQLCLLH